MIKVINGDLCHDILIQNKTPKFKYCEQKNFSRFQKKCKAKLIELLGIDKIALNKCDLNFEIEAEEDKGYYNQIRFHFDSEIGATVPAYLLVPKKNNKKFPLVITLQGHTTGFHNSVGIIKSKEDEEFQPIDQYAVQAVKRGYVALAIEQRAFGESRTQDPLRKTGQMCAYSTFTAIMLGRTLIGERVWDIMKAIDLLERFDYIDLKDITITGHSGGGTASYYASAIDERIKVCAPSCAVCTFEESILKMCHCSCNYIPNILQWFNIEDIAVLIAPRKLVHIVGEKDPIFLIEGSRIASKTISEIYNDIGKNENYKYIETPGEHTWCENIVWVEIEKMRQND